MNTTTTSITTIAADGTAVRSEITGVKRITVNDLSVIGLKRVNAKAKAELLEAGAYVPAGASPELLTVMSVCSKTAKQAAQAGKTAATALALAEESGEYKILHGEDGKLYGSFSAFCEAMLPGLSSTTRSSYLNAARTIYLPAARGELEKGLEILADLEPGTALSACGALNDEVSRKRLPAAIADVMKGKKRLTQALLKKAASNARHGVDPAPTPDPAPTTEMTPSTDTPAQDAAMTPVTPTPATTTPAPAGVDMEAAVYSAIERIFSPDIYHYADDDGKQQSNLTMATAPAEYKDMFAMLKAACDNGESALMFCRMFQKALTNAVKGK